MRRLVMTLAVALAACGHLLRPTPEVQVPPFATAYSTQARPGGLKGTSAAHDAEELLLEHLKSRGDAARSDGALADTAAWYLRNLYDRNEVSDIRILSDVSRRFGFTGWVAGFMAGAFEDEKARAFLKDLVGQAPKNRRINRYGIVGGAGLDAAVVLGVVEAELADFPRALAPDGTLALTGRVSERYERTSLFVTNPQGQVNETAMAGRAVNSALRFHEPGRYMVEMMGYGAEGPVVLMNVPIHVGLPEKDVEQQGKPDPTLTAGDAEAALLRLLNDARRGAGLGPVHADAELRAVALGHSRDMAKNHFFGHVSPTTGSAENRLRTADLRISKFGECVALEITPSRSLRLLLDSPSHRAAMLEPSFTHVGIGVAFSQYAGARHLVSTLVFGRRVDPQEANQSAQSVLEAIRAQREARKLPLPRVDPGLQAMASAGLRVLKARPAALQEALGASGSVCQVFVEIIERAELAGLPLLTRAELTRIGVDVALREHRGGPRLGVWIAAQGSPDQELRCE